MHSLKPTFDLLILVSSAIIVSLCLVLVGSSIVTSVDDEADAHHKVLFYAHICSEREQLARVQLVFCLQEWH